MSPQQGSSLSSLPASLAWLGPSWDSSLPLGSVHGGGGGGGGGGGNDDDDDDDDDAIDDCRVLQRGWSIPKSQLCLWGQFIVEVVVVVVMMMMMTTTMTLLMTAGFSSVAGAYLRVSSAFGVSSRSWWWW